MSAIAIRRRLQRHRRRFALSATLVVLAGALAIHHSGVEMDVGMHHDPMVGAVAQMCVGVFTAVGAALAAVGIGIIPLWRRPVLAPPSFRRAVRMRSIAGRARHGPAAVSFLCVSRR